MRERIIQHLLDIGELTPKRTFYPEDLRVMQMVEKQDLPALCCHEGFGYLVNMILREELAIIGITGYANMCEYRISIFLEVIIIYCSGVPFLKIYALQYVT